MKIRKSEIMDVEQSFIYISIQESFRSTEKAEESTSKKASYQGRN